MNDRRTIDTTVHRIDGRSASTREDEVAVEEPLEIRLRCEDAAGARVDRTVSITMRTPGHDYELALGFLFSEGILEHRRQLADAPAERPLACNTVQVELEPGVTIDLARLERHFYTTSSCGVCGKTSIAALGMGREIARVSDGITVAAATIHALPATLRREQSVFDRTGGLHAAAVFDREGRLLALREDVGRHNAVDKVIGAELLADRLPLRDGILFLSGRVSFELMQKAIMAGLPIVAAVGAPSSLAITLAHEYGTTVLGFVREERFNIYAGAHRIREMHAGAEVVSAQA